MKMTYQTWYGHHEFLVMSFGLTNSLSAIMNLMSKVFNQYHDMFVIALLMIF